MKFHPKKYLPVDIDGDCRHRIKKENSSIMDAAAAYTLHPLHYLTHSSVLDEKYREQADPSRTISTGNIDESCGDIA